MMNISTFKMPDIKRGGILPVALLFTLASSLSGCVNTHDSGSELIFQGVSPGGWSPAASIEFVADSVYVAESKGEPNDVEVIIRYSTMADTETLPIEAVRESYAGRELRDTLILRLFDNSGNPSGKGTYAVYETSAVIPGEKLSEGWRILLTPLSEAKGIHAAGIRLTPSRK